MIDAAKRPPLLSGRTERFRLGCGSLYITVNSNDGQPFEVFATLGKAGGCAHAMLEGICRLTSLHLRHGLPLKEIADYLSGIRCPYSAWEDGAELLSCPDCIARALSGETIEAAL